ncbi:MAG TPA: type II toxin-antitoxin system death-on-curing family toxin [Bryobacteraceae bacterium]|nr:type II toxin-antitoxin system death-on-curing family toxin [Bryobacteraceae bacterium]
MSEPQWINLPVVMAIYEEQLAEHGGGAGVRDRGLLESALARPRQIYAYADDPSPAQLAAAYAFDIAKNHPFVDANKRTAFVVCAVFLELNGGRLTATQADVVRVMLAVDGGRMKEDEFARWLESNSR